MRKRAGKSKEEHKTKGDRGGGTRGHTKNRKGHRAHKGHKGHMGHKGHKGHRDHMGHKGHTGNRDYIWVSNMEDKGTKTSSPCSKSACS